MQFIPICLECDNFKNRDVCIVYKTPPFEIKNREKRCPHFTGEEYVLYTKDSEPEVL
jgi:hypothetical protein